MSHAGWRWDLPLRVPHRVRVALLAILVAILVGWIRMLPLELAPLDDYASELTAGNHSGDEHARKALAAGLKSVLEYRGDDNQQHVFLGDADSYYWLRMARNLERTGTVCDSMVGGRCWDSLTRAPLGRPNLFGHSLHVYAIARLHRLFNLLWPGYPLPAASFLIPVLLGAIGTLPAFAIGFRLGGVAGGVAAAVAIGLNPLFLRRSIGSDNDVWNVVLPVFELWAIVKALETRRTTAKFIYALAAAIVVGIHAGIWSGWILTYSLIALGLIVSMVIALTAKTIDSEKLRRASTLVVAVFCLGGVLAALGVTRAPSAILSNPLNRLPYSPFKPLVQGMGYQSLWPDIINTDGTTNIEELRALDLAGVAAAVGGRIYFALGYLGLVVISLSQLIKPQRYLWTIAIAALLYAFALTFTKLPPLLTMLAVSIPLLAVKVQAAISVSNSEPDRQAVAWILVVWFVAGLFLSLQGARFVITLLPPIGFGISGAIGAFQRSLSIPTERLKPAAIGLVHGVAFASFALLVAGLIHQGYAEARGYLPQINTAWWSVLEKLKLQSPSDAIVVTWWDYGYWTQYFAERRVLVDGGSIRSHIPYWIAKALLAPTEAQSVGLLRMLECGSDSQNEAGSGQGAFTKLRANGVSEIAADETILKLAGLDRSEARKTLVSLGLTPSECDDVLNLTHCSPPASYLVLSSSMVDMASLRYAGNWDMRKALSTTRTQNSTSSSSGYLSENWNPCFPIAGNQLNCPLGLHGVPLSATAILQSIEATDTSGAARVSLVVRANLADSPNQVAAPGLVIVATNHHLIETSRLDSAYPDLAVLLDADRKRVLIGPAFLIRSTFTRLMYLGDSYSRYYRKLDQARGYDGERVLSWRIDWDRVGEQASTSNAKPGKARSIETPDQSAAHTYNTAVQ